MYYYVGTVILRMTPREFWHTTPRKLSALAQVHVDLNSPKDSKHKKNSVMIDGVEHTVGGKIAKNKSCGGVGAPDAFVDQIF